MKRTIEIECPDGEQTDSTDCILLPQEDPSYWYVKFDELRIE